jgi:hypothetical protein
VEPVRFIVEIRLIGFILIVPPRIIQVVRDIRNAICPRREFDSMSISPILESERWGGVVIAPCE